MLYLAQVITYTGILWLLYMLLLRNRPMHAFNRMYLLAASILPVIIPLLQLPQAMQHKLAAKAPINLTLPEMVVGNTASPAVTTPVHTIAWGAIIYSTVALIALLSVAMRWLQIRRLIKRNKAIALDGYTLLQNTGYGPGSWGRYVFLPDAEVDDVIIQHELAHVKLRHSADIMLLSIMQCLLWPNVFLYTIKKELRQVHEFQADAKAVGDADSYSQLLLSSVFNTCTLPFAHSFIIHPIKRRIMMLHKSKNTFINKAVSTITTVLAVAILSTVLVLQSCSKERQIMNADTITDLSKAPCSPYGTEWNTYMNTHLTYPVKAKMQQLEGKVMVKFIVDKDGSIVDPQIVRSTDTVFSEAALDLIKGMPKWTPGEKNGRKVAVAMYQPFSFKLNNITKVSYSFDKMPAHFDLKTMKPSTVTRGTRITMGDARHSYDSAVSDDIEMPQSLRDEIDTKVSDLTAENIKSLDAAAKRIQEAHNKIAIAQEQIDASQKEINEQSKKAEELYLKERELQDKLIHTADKINKKK